MKKAVFILIIVSLLTLSMRAVDGKDELRLKYFSEKAYDETIDPDVRLAYIDSLILLSFENRPSLIIDKAVLMGDAGMNKTANAILEKLKDGSKEFPLGLRLKLMYRYACSLQNLNDCMDALLAADELLKTPKPDSLKYWDFKAELLKFNIYHQFEDVLKARQCLQLAERMLPNMQLTEAEQREAEAKVHGSWANIFILENNLDMAYKEIIKARQIAGNNTDKINSLIQLASLYIGKGEPQMAQKYAEDALKIPINNRAKRTAIYVFALSRLQQNDPNGVLEILKQYPSDRLNDNVPINLKSYYIIRGLAYASVGKLNLAYNSLDSALYVTEGMVNYLVAMQRLNTEKYLEANRKLGKADHNARVFFWLMVGTVSVCVLLFCSQLVLAGRNRRLKRKALENREGVQVAHDASEMLRQQQEAAAEYEERSERRYSSSLMKLSQLQGFVAKISDVIGADVPDKEKVLEINNLVHLQNMNENLLELFQLQLEETNHEFVARLSKRYPDLTKAELRMCLFMLHNMPNKEIAELIGRTPHTVGNTKHSLRRKMRLPAEISTEDYLRSFL